MPVRFRRFGGDGDIRTLACRAQANRQADATARAGDKQGFAGETGLAAHVRSAARAKLVGRFSANAANASRASADCTCVAK
jgi:hypothetical protein